MKSLTERQILALRSLEKIQMGATTIFLNWADADSLVEIGLAEQFGLGKYAITEKGLDTLRQFPSKE